MTRSVCAATLCLALALARAAAADTVDARDGSQITPGVYGMYADGTYDCSDKSQAYIGAVVIADLSYAFIHADGSLGHYGKLNKDDWVDAPAFFVLSGELKDRFSVVGLSLRGPLGKEEDYSGDTILQAVITAEDRFVCIRRRGP